VFSRVIVIPTWYSNFFPNFSIKKALLKEPLEFQQLFLRSPQKAAKGEELLYTHLSRQNKKHPEGC